LTLLLLKVQHSLSYLIDSSSEEDLADMLRSTLHAVYHQARVAKVGDLLCDAVERFNTSVSSGDILDLSNLKPSLSNMSSAISGFVEALKPVITGLFLFFVSCVLLFCFSCFWYLFL